VVPPWHWSQGHKDQPGDTSLDIYLGTQLQILWPWEHVGSMNTRLLACLGPQPYGFSLKYHMQLSLPYLIGKNHNEDWGSLENRRQP
jgi:hypothetical protein